MKDDEKEIKDDEVADAIEMSDEDFLKSSEVDFEEESSDTTDKDNEEVDSTDEDSTDEDNDSTNEDTKETSDEDDSEDSTDDNSDADDDKFSDAGTDDVDEDSFKEEKEDSKDKDTKSETESKEDKDLDIDELTRKAEAFDKVTSTFTANGMEMRVDNAEDIITLMQMGANYNKKMVGLKPNIKLLKLLEQNDLLDQDKLNYLIDLNKKDPKAITKLLKDSNIDPMDIDVKEESNYTPTKRDVSDTEVAIDAVLENIQDSPHFPKTLNVITKEWDKGSREIIAESPQIIAVINEHIEQGIYDKIASAMTLDRSLGKLNGLNDIQAYKAVGDRLDKEGAFGKPTKPTNDSTTDEAEDKQTRTVSKKDAAVRKERKKAAVSTKKKVGNTNDIKFDPLNMPDDEFEKLDASKFGI